MIQVKIKKSVMGLSLLICILIVLLISNVSADGHLPESLLKVIEYNMQQSQEFMLNVTFFIAFLAGITSILSPCILPILPAYFSLTFTEKKRRTLATSAFFIGFSLVFVSMGLLATLTGEALVKVFQNINWLIPVAGGLLIIFGAMMILGKGFSGLHIRKNFGKSFFSLIGAGALFAIGWTACTGPILSGVIMMAGIFNNYFQATMFMLFYSLGIFVPLFLLSVFQEKIPLNKIKIITKPITFTLLEDKYHTTILNIFSGSLFIFLGTIFIFYNGTSIFNSFQMFGLRSYFYSLQDVLLTNSSLYTKIGIIILVIFLLIVGWKLRKETKEFFRKK